MTDPWTDPLALAHDEIVALHVLLQAWFRGEADADRDSILMRFDAGYTMIGAAGRRVAYRDFAAMLPGLRGSRPDLLMQIDDVHVCHETGTTLLAMYRETQTAAGTRDVRLSSVLFTRRPDGRLAWKHLQETFLPG